jgi:muconolactone delta-isomerase
MPCERCVSAGPYVLPMGSRTFVVRVSESEPRVVVEDVRSRERVVAANLAAVGEAIRGLLDNEGKERTTWIRAEPPA